MKFSSVALHSNRSARKINNHSFLVSEISIHSFFFGGVSVEGGSERASFWLRLPKGFRVKYINFSKKPIDCKACSRKTPFFYLLESKGWRLGCKTVKAGDIFCNSRFSFLRKKVIEKSPCFWEKKKYDLLRSDTWSGG